ncbi:MAG: AraC family transcriptional regulator [Paenibacillus sp.]|jgi:AraC-like DNA-binding protein|nr:AraC family transcriptional regulator [Paenibacillus sp.]
MIVAKALEQDLYFFRYLSTRDESSEPVYYFHTHQGIEILYVYEGSGHVILDDRFYAVNPRTLIIFKPFQLHCIRMDIPPKYTCSLFKVKPSFLDQCAHFLPRCHDMISGFINHNESRQIFQLNDAQHVQLDDRFRNLFETLRTSPLNMHEEAVILFVLNFFVDLTIKIMPNANAGQPIKPFRTTQRVGEVLKWIDANYKEQFKLDKLAEDLHYSASYMSKLFRRQTGKSIPEYVTEKRLEQARILLHTQTLSVEEISEQTGFNSPSYFIRTFKNKYGVPPHQYRLNVSKMY